MTLARVLVCGGRDYADRAFVWDTLDRLHRESGVEVVIHGDATGADTLAREWAVARRVTHDPHPAQWDRIEGIPSDLIRRNRRGERYNVRAGFERNQHMLTRCPTHAIAFPGGRGTADMCHRICVATNRGQQIEFLDLRGHR